MILLLYSTVDLTENLLNDSCRAFFEISLMF